jgi:2'-5' RNA ligase
MDEYYDSVMVALLPVNRDWCRQDLPHMTISYLGHVPDLRESVHNELLKQALRLSMAYPSLQVPVTNVTEFGTDELVNVLLLEKTTELIQLYEFFKEWDITDFSFTPHCTIGPTGSIVGVRVPEFIRFDRILVSWGQANTIYRLVGEADDVQPSQNQQGSYDDAVG